MDNIEKQYNTVADKLTVKLFATLCLPKVGGIAFKPVTIFNKNGCLSTQYYKNNNYFHEFISQVSYNTAHRSSSFCTKML